MDFARALGLDRTAASPEEERNRLHLYINLKLASSGQPTCTSGQSTEFMETVHDLLKSHREKNRLLSTYLCPVDRRIQDFLDRYLKHTGVEPIPTLPTESFMLDRHGVARELSLPMGEDEFRSDIVSSYRVKQGVLHNPASDRRTTKGSFHIAEGGLPIPGDKKAVPKRSFALMLKQALQPPPQMLTLPFTSNQPTPARMFASLLLRPIVCPEIPGKEMEKSMEMRFFAPGNLVGNLDFVESIFGNGGNPNLAEFNAGLDVEHWTGHTGCVILAPHLTRLTKKAVGLPEWEHASERQRRDCICWSSPDELYNDGQSFKLTARDQSGVIVTLIADNYFGYCKKEVKTQISFAANLFGAGSEGALTKGPFNALRPTPDLNNTLVSFILTGYPGFSSSAGYIGPDIRVNHDISLLVPEIWARLDAEERDPGFLIQAGYLEPVENFDHNGQRVLASRLGYRITDRFVHSFLGKIFDNPNTVFTQEILRPETQDTAVFADGVNNIVEAQQRVALQYLEDGSAEDACPPLKALILIMAHGQYQGMDERHPKFRALFSREALLSSDWYRERLEIKQQRDIVLWRRHVDGLRRFLNLASHADQAERLNISQRLDAAAGKLELVESDAYLESLVGTIGADPLRPARSETKLGTEERVA